MESIAMELKHRGCYVARRLDQGSAQFSIEEVPLNFAQLKLYNASTRLWSMILDGIGSGRHRFRYYWAAHQRFFRLLSLSFKLSFLVTYVR